MPDSPVRHPLRSTILHFAEFLIIAVSVLTPYWYSLESEFVLDDHALIRLNPHFETEGIYRRLLLGDYLEFSGAEGRSRYWRPSVRLSFQLDYLLAGKSPFAFHMGNLILFGLIGGLLYTFLRQSSSSRIAGFIGTLLYAFHPARAESVVWISGRTDLMMTLGVLAAVICYQKTTTDQKRRVLWGLLMAVSAVLAVSSKETGVMLPAIVILSAPVMAWRHKVAAFVLAIPSLLYPIPKYLSVHALGSWHGAHVEPMLVPALALKTIGYYARLVFFPVCLNTEHWFPYPVSYLDSGVLTGLGCLAVLVFVLWKHRSDPLIRLGVAWFALALFPHLNIVPIPNLAAERFLTSPAIGLSMIAAGWLAKTMRNGSKWVSVPAALILSGAGLACGVVAYEQTGHWETGELVVARAAECGESARAKFWLGSRLMSEKKPEEALAAFRLAAEREEVPTANINYSVALVAVQVKDYPTAETYLRKALGIDPNHLPAGLTLAETLLRQNKIDDAAVQAEGILQRRGDEPVAHLVLAEIAALHRQDVEGARRHLEAVVANPNAPAPQRGYAQARLEALKAPL